MKFGSVCSGIGSPEVAWSHLGWQSVFMSEIEPFPRAVLAHHFAGVSLHGDFTTIAAGQYEPIELLVGGTPCQSFSVAGLRGGLGDERGNLALEYLRLADRLRPRWLVWENVPGVLSSNDGRDFGSILGGMVELGYGFAYRVLDAQHFRVPQRRRRVFVVGYLGDWRRAAAVLFERHSLSGHPAPRRETATPVADLTATGVGTCGADDNQGQAGHLIPAGIGHDGQTARSLTASHTASHTATGRLDPNESTLIAHTLRGEGYDASEDGSGRGTPLVPVCFSAKDHGGDAAEDIAPTLRAGGHTGSHPNAGVMPAVAYGIRSDAMREGAAKAPSADAAGRIRLRDPGMGVTEERAQALTGGGNRPSARGGDLIAASAVRRLTPTECERLQGFPDGFTLIPWRKGFASDGPRYKALGNSMAVPVMRWLGERIALVDGI